jgi:plasmid stabilization system protein ParE
LREQKVLTLTKILFSNRASKNLIAQAKYIYEQTNSVELSDKYLNKMKTFIVEMLSKFPKSGRPSEQLAPNTRKFVYQGFSIIYRLSGERVEILTIYRENLP